MALDIMRHVEVVNPNDYDKNINVIGVGATGSWLAFQLAKLGFKNIHLYDFDNIESHNIPNQMFKISQIGMNKAEAMVEIIEDFGLEAYAHNVEVDMETPLTGAVFILTDTMSSRKEIFESLKFKQNIDVVIETRMDYNGGRLYTLSPNNILEIREYEKTLYDDEDVVAPSACGASQSIVATANDIVSHAVWAFINHVNGVENYNEVFLDTQFNNIMTRDFKEVL